MAILAVPVEMKRRRQRMPGIPDALYDLRQWGWWGGDASEVAMVIGAAAARLWPLARPVLADVASRG